MAFIDTIKERAKADKKTIVLPESMDKRTYEAAEKILKEGIANLVIIGTPEEIEKYGKGYDISGATIVDPFNDPNKQKYIDKFVELRSKKGVTPEMAKEQMEKDYMYYACLMCKCGQSGGQLFDHKEFQHKGHGHHNGHFVQSHAKGSVGNAAGVQGNVINDHAIHHDGGHDDGKYDSLRQCFGHRKVLLSEIKTADKKERQRNFRLAVFPCCDYHLLWLS